MSYARAHRTAAWVVRTCLAALLVCSLAPLYFSAAVAGGGVSFAEDDGLIRIGNSHYEVGIDRATGGILYIRDIQAGADVSIGNAGGLLWWAFFSSGDWTQSTYYSNAFRYEWDSNADQLTLLYPASAENSLDVEVILSFSLEDWFKIEAQVSNEGRSSVQTFGFPYQLLTPRAQVKNALIPLMPGVILDRAFFSDGKSYTAQYPGVAFSDFLALDSESGRLALYGQRTGALQPAVIGFEKTTDGEAYKLIHDYNTWIEPSTTWKSPNLYIKVGADYREAIAAFRLDSGIAQFRGLGEKLGDRKQQFFRSPLYKLDVELIAQPFEKLKRTVIDTIDIPGMVHPVAFQPGGHDVNYPDFLPPAEHLGTIDEFADLIQYAKERGNLVVPYTNLSWWDADGPTLSNLPSGLRAEDVTVLNRNGTKNMESYGTDRDGYVMNLHNSFVKDRIGAEHAKLIEELNMDGIFEDQWGARSAPYDFNPAGLELYDPSTSYFEGVLDHVRTHAANNLMTEVGVDMLAECEVAFMGTNFLWDKLGYRTATAPYSHYYPMAGMLFRDKVMLYQHDLAQETWTNDQDMFRWNLAMGYNLSHAFYFNGSLYTANPWIDLVGMFQRYVLSGYADQLIESYENIGSDIYRTRYPDYTVYSNWGDTDTFSIGGHVVPPGGAVVVSDDGSVTGGSFKSYNNRALSDGEHYIVELREEDSIRIYQPVGADTPLAVRKGPEWAGAEVKAYTYGGSLIGSVDAAADGDLVVFDCQSTIDSQRVGYYELTASPTPNEPLVAADLRPDLVIRDIRTSPSDPSVGDQVVFEVVIENAGLGPTPEGVPLDVILSVDVTAATFWTKLTDPLPPGAVVTVPLTSGSGGGVWTAALGSHVVNAVVDDYNRIAESAEDNNYLLKLLPEIKESSISAGTEEPIERHVYAFKIDRDGFRLDQVFDEAFGVVSDEALSEGSDIAHDEALGKSSGVARDGGLGDSSREALNEAFSEIFDLFAYNDIERVVVGSIDSAQDASGRFGLLWDDENLYFLADVTDDIKNMKPGQSAWQNDSLELYLDMNNSGGNTYMKDDFQFMFSWNNTRPYEFKHNAVDGVFTRSFDTDNGYRILAAIPWTTLGVTPSDGMPFGVDAAIDDNDTGTRDAQLIWNSYDEHAWQFPDRFGSGRLVEDAKPDLRITGIGWEPEAVRVGDELRFAVTLTNQGTAASPEGVVHKISVGASESGQLFWSDSFASSLAPGESVVILVDAGTDGIYWTLREGKNTVVASVDDEDLIEELDETNNTAKRIIGL